MLSTDLTFVPGVEILKYDGVDIDEAVLKLGRNTYAAKFASRQF